MKMLLSTCERASTEEHRKGRRLSRGRIGAANGAQFTQNSWPRMFQHLGTLRSGLRPLLLPLKRVGGAISALTVGDLVGRSG